MSKKMNYAIDLPNPENLNGECVTVEYFETKKQALKFASPECRRGIKPMARLRDKNGLTFRAGQLVQVPDPKPGTDDFWAHAFQGTVHCQTQHQFVRGGSVVTRSTKLICVTDQDGNGWDVEADRLEILE